MIRLERIVPDPNQPRRTFVAHSMEELIASIQARGIKQPLTVRWDAAEQRYRVIDGGRRYEAAKRLGLESVPCWVQRAEGRELVIDQVVHNWVRADLEPTETGAALARLRDEFGMTQQEISSVTGKPKGEISKFLAIHDGVIADVKQLAVASESTATPLSKRHLYNLSRLPENEQRELAQRAVEERMTAVEMEKLVRKRTTGDTTKISRSGLAARQRKFHTPLADVLITFRKKGATDVEVRAVCNAVLERLENPLA